MIGLPRPRLLRGIERIAAEPAPKQLAAVAELVRRAERIRAGGVNPREDNMPAAKSLVVGYDPGLYVSALSSFPALPSSAPDPVNGT